jgi:sigma-B regulation protein RsbU (phosphoserine phosphatase)
VPTSAAPAPAGVPSARILVVDDVEANRESLARRLARRGYEVEMAAGGQEALDRIAADPPLDLVLLDVMMPGVSGLDVLSKVRETRPPADLPIVMATAKDSSEDVVHAMKLGANDYVTKPIDFPVVLARVQTQLALRRSVEQIRQLERELSERNAALERAAERTQRELAFGARVQAAMLPNDVQPIDGLTFAWAFRPCEHLAGDALNICPIARGVVGVYVLDVVGHGVASSLLSVAAMRALGGGPASNSILVAPDGSPAPPAEVARQLDDAFPFNSDTRQFFTLFYALIDVNAHTIRYVSAGHPGAIVVSRSAPPRLLNRNCTPIGIGGPQEDHVEPFASGDRLYLYSDGIIEAVRADGERFGTERLVEDLAAQASAPLRASVDALLAVLDEWRGGVPSHDDVTLLAVERV